MRRTARRSRRGAVAVALAAGVISVAAAPSGAQDPDPTTSTSSTTTVTPAPTTPTTAPPATTTPTTPATGGDAVPEQPALSPPATGTTTATTAMSPTTVTPPATTPQAGPEPLAAAAVTLDPANDMGDGTPVTITVTRLPAGAWVEALQCTSAVESETPSGISDHCDGFDVYYTDGNGDGTAALTLRVDALLTAGWDEPEVTDCRVPGAA